MAWPDNLTIEEQQVEIKNSIVKDIANHFFNQIPFYYQAPNAQEKYVDSVKSFR